MSLIKPRWWLTPPDVYEKLNDEFQFDFDPCPCPRPSDYNSLVVPWGKVNYINPPFLKSDAPHGGPASFVRKAIEEQAKGNTSVFILPAPWSIGLLMRGGQRSAMADKSNGWMLMVDRRVSVMPRKSSPFCAVKENK
jgi:hypothetical protein